MAERAPRAGRRLAQLARPVVWCLPDERVRDAARRIGAAGHSCALVATDLGLGIVTDHDFRHRVATGEVGIDAPVSALVTVPAITIDEAATQAAGLLLMLEHAVHHLVVTDPSGRPTGVVRAVDLAQSEVRDPLLVRAAVESCADLDELAATARRLPATVVELRDNQVAAPYVAAVHAAMVDAIVRRVLRLRQQSLRQERALAATRHSWVLLGSLARREASPGSDLDTALVWADPPAPGAAGRGRAIPAAEATGTEIRSAAGRVLDDLRACGLRPCPNGTNADNPTFARAESDWRETIAAWQRDPAGPRALLMAATIADSRPLTEPSLGNCLSEPAGTAARDTRFLRALLDEALRFRPPTGFVRDFVVAHNGEHRGQLDLKRGGLAPIVALGRWVGIVTGETRATTPRRLLRGAETGLLTADEGQTLAGAFEDLYTLLLDHEVAALRAGTTATTYLAPATLDTLTRRHLRESFRAVRAVQARLDEHWLARLERSDRGRSG